MPPIDVHNLSTGEEESEHMFPTLPSLPRTTATPAHFVGGALGVLVLALFLYVGTHGQEPAVPFQTSGGDEGVTETLPVSLGNVPIAAEAAYVLDFTDRTVLFEKNADAQLPLASITKLMTAVAALKSAPPGTVLPIEEDHLAADGVGGIMVGERWRLDDLLMLILTRSSNDGARAVASIIGAVLAPEEKTADEARKLFVNVMNETAQSLGLTQTYFINETGLDEGLERAGGYGSARDVALLLEYVFRKHPVIFSATRSREVFVESGNGSRTVENTNNAAEKIPGLIGGKTGLTDLAGGNLAVVIDVGVNHPVGIVVLGSTEENRFTDVSTLAWETLWAVQKK